MIPSALLKRLAKRGIINDKEIDTEKAPSEKRSKTNDQSTTEANNYEEIIAEHSSNCLEIEERSSNGLEIDEYDQVNLDAFEYKSKKKDKPGDEWREQMKRKMTARFGYQAVEGCQNKYNIYHKCTMYCVTRYGEVEFEIDKDYDKRHKRLIQRYPLPKNWRKNYDIGCKAFYYYNKDSHLVSWLPPTHPDSKISKSAKALRRELMDQTNDFDDSDDQAPQAYVVESYPPVQSKMDNDKERGTTTLKPPIVAPPRRPHNKSRRDRGRDRDYDD